LAMALLTRRTGHGKKKRWNREIKQTRKKSKGRKNKRPSQTRRWSRLKPNCYGWRQQKQDNNKTTR
jgi:hypothetical protein